VGWIVDEIPANFAHTAQYFLALADEVAVSSLAQPTAERPEVAVVRHPIADARNNVVGYELRFGGSVDLGDPAMDAKATSALLVDAFGDIGLEQLAAATPPG
jgi:EAL and modified HD-GYP domain-containing signal transduction protein